MGGGIPRGHRIERARRPLQRCGGRRSRVYKTKPGAFPAGRTCAGSGQAEGGGARSARSSCSGPPRLRPRSSSSRALRRCAAPGRPGAGGDQCPTPYSPFWWPRGCVTAAPAWGFRAPAGSAGPGGRGSPAPEAAPEGGAEQRGVRPPGCGAEGWPIVRMRRPRPSGAAAGTPTNGELEPPPAKDCSGTEVPRRRPQGVNPSKQNLGTWPPASSRSAPRAAPGAYLQGWGRAEGRTAAELGPQQRRQGSDLPRGGGGGGGGVCPERWSREPYCLPPAARARRYKLRAPPRPAPRGPPHPIAPTPRPRRVRKATKKLRERSVYLFTLCPPPAVCKFVLSRAPFAPGNIYG